MDSVPKYLESVLDKGLNFEFHIKSLLKKLKITLYLKRNVQISTKIYKIYYAHVFMKISYLMTFWAQAGKNNINKLQSVQNKIVKQLFQK